MKKNQRMLTNSNSQPVIASLISILIGLIIGAVFVLIVGISDKSLGINSAWEGVRLIFAGIFSTGRDAAGALTWGFNSTNVGNMLFRAMPLIMTGLSVAFAYKTGLFNIGAPGQYLMGTMAALMIALGIPSDKVSPVIIWILAFLGAAVAGAIWGAIPGLFKAYLGTNEVIVCIMTNWILINFI